MQERSDVGKDDAEKEGYRKGVSRKEECRKGGIQEMTDARNERSRN